jgi:uncharacterized protein YeaO (DUF488 family)
MGLAPAGHAVIRIKRAYDPPEATDGYRVLVDRVWPRGLSRESLQLHEWARHLGPSDQLRRWFGHDPARWEEFRQRYRRELASPELEADLRRLRDLARHQTVTLVYSARDEEHNQARVLAEFLAEFLAEPGAGAADPPTDRSTDPPADPSARPPGGDGDRQG